VQPGARLGLYEVVAQIGTGLGEAALHVIRTDVAGPLKRGDGYEGGGDEP
jgi:hypothetical protein